MRSVLYGFFLTCFICIAAMAQTPRVIDGGLLNGKAVKLPKPVYPDEARIAKVGGTVLVEVTIDEGGNVISAKRVTPAAKAKDEDTEADRLRGLLEDAAENAAMQASFAPTLLNNVPVKVTGKIAYNFVPDEDKESIGKTISGGILNGKATSLPQPAYPPAAAAVKAEGTVSVYVTVDEDGRVISATAVSGHPLLQAAAVEAAKSAKFSPVILSGKPVKVSGVISYHFSLPKPEQN
jgi:TonB family protein